MAIQQIIPAYPLASIAILSFLITLALTLLYKRFSNQEGIKSSKERAKMLQEKIKSEKDQTKTIGMQKEMLEISMEQMRYNMKPMLITFLPLIGIFAGLRYLYSNVGVIIPWRFSIPGLCKILPGLCDGAGWFLSYVIFSMVFSIILRKLLKVH